MYKPDERFTEFLAGMVGIFVGYFVAFTLGGSYIESYIAFFAGLLRRLGLDQDLAFVALLPITAPFVVAALWLERKWMRGRQGPPVA